MMEASERLDKIDWAVASYPLPGETESGDLHIVKRHSQGVLVGVVDGLGHGSDAAFAAKVAVKTLSQFPHESVISLVRRCHEQLLQTRGVVMSLASFFFGDDTVTLIGIGNVEGVLGRSDGDSGQSMIHIVQRGGVVGYQLPQLHASVLPVTSGDTLILATDGIRSEFYDKLPLHDEPRNIVKEIGERFRKESDDSLVLAVRYR